MINILSFPYIPMKNLDDKYIEVWYTDVVELLFCGWSLTDINVQGDDAEYIYRINLCSCVLAEAKQCLK